MKVCMVTSSYPRFAGDGTAPFVQSIAEHVARQGHQVHVLAPYDPQVRLRESGPTPVTVHRFKYVWPDSWCLVGHARSLERDVRMKKAVYLLTPLYLLFGFLALARLHRQHRFDVLHAHWLLPSGFLALLFAKAWGLPLIVSLHGSDVYVAEKSPVFAPLGGLVLRLSDFVTACSEDLKHRASRLGKSKSDVRVIPYGASPALFGTSGDSSALRASLDIAPDDLVVFGLGRLVYKKGFEYLIRAIPLIVDDFGQVKVVIGGSGPLLSELEQLSEELGVRDQVRLPGRIDWDEVPAYFDLCDVFVAPSIRDRAGNVDGLPNTILEAMASSRPIVASNVAGIPAVIEDGKNGFLVEERNPAQLAEAIKRLLASRELRDRLGEASRRKVEQELNWDKVAEQFVALYQDACSRG
jgi:glycosyltransferase involved in cell wall biosynthesis